MKTIIELFERAKDTYPNKVAFGDNNYDLTFSELYDSAKRIGTGIARLNLFKKPVVLYFEKNNHLCEARMAVTYSGNFYVCMDTTMPVDRVMTIFDSLDPALIITDDNLRDKIEYKNVNIVTYSDLKKDIDQDLLESVYDRIIDTDICYAIYTSGSTGKPKGTVVCHNALIKYLEWFTKEMGIDNNTVFGGQTQFYFSASISDFYSTIIMGASYYMIPKSYFMFPMKIIELLNEKKVNTIYWVPSALALLANYDVFKYAKPLYLKKIMFAGEVMHVKHLNYLISYLPDCTYTNLFGPTETVDICTYYTVDRSFNPEESLPIGKHCNNCDTFVLKDDDTKALPNEIGELCVRGSFLASGYYNMPEKTQEAFCPNPLQKAYPERIYRTGDLVMENERGEYIYMSRKDFQIKHMGYRIELGEIETSVTSMDKIKSCVCIYDNENDMIILIYEGRVKDDEIFARCKDKLPSYMVPNKVIKVPTMALNQNGKIDRNYYKNNYKNL
ncbi:MAG: AMP-binding protein [Acholeplasmatales bacterium]|nr:AMP-binding protein [Acholeplasmatales bacterium]